MNYIKNYSIISLINCVLALNTIYANNINNIIEKEEDKRNIPAGLLKAIGQVESKLKPYAINHKGKSYIFDSASSTIKFAQKLLNKGNKNFSIGCFQLHYKTHVTNFKSLNKMIDPKENIAYAAKLLCTLYKQNGYSWNKAVRKYHSANYRLNSKYIAKVSSKYGHSI